ncbi:MAG: flagellar biosynthetic protein FliO [Firmicutes bacterium]|nr:flagellar biosynthetic protein FliO [Bacillota bacterium]MDH7495387.1 flagellar biosynthetic protein FliO [Bacillota bacterium]
MDVVVTGIRLAVSLALVIALIYLVGLALRSLQWRRAGRRGRPAMELCESLPLGPGRAVHLVRVGDRLLVLGATGTHVSMLAELAPGSLDEAERQEGPAGAADSESGRRFHEVLKAYMGRFGDSEDSGEDTGEGDIR